MVSFHAAELWSQTDGTAPAVVNHSVGLTPQLLIQSYIKYMDKSWKTTFFLSTQYGPCSTQHSVTGDKMWNRLLKAQNLKLMALTVADYWCLSHYQRLQCISLLVQLDEDVVRKIQQLQMAQQWLASNHRPTHVTVSNYRESGGVTRHKHPLLLSNAIEQRVAITGQRAPSCNLESG